MTVAEIKHELDALGVEHKATKRGDLLDMLLPEFRVMSLTKATEDAKERAICSILGSRSGNQPPDPVQVDPLDDPPLSPRLWAVWNGLKLEEEAVSSFSLDTDMQIESVGFCEHPSGLVGCSPDGLIPSEGSGIENKCPIPSTHVRYLRAGVLPEDYKDQVHFSMAVTGAASWWFQSYCVDLPPLRVRVEWDSYTDLMLEGIRRFAVDLSAAEMKLNREIKRYS